MLALVGIALFADGWSPLAFSAEALRLPRMALAEKRVGIRRPLLLAPSYRRRLDQASLDAVAERQCVDSPR